MADGRYCIFPGCQRPAADRCYEHEAKQLGLHDPPRPDLDTEAREIVGLRAVHLAQAKNIVQAFRDTYDLYGSLWMDRLDSLAAGIAGALAAREEQGRAAGRAEAADYVETWGPVYSHRILVNELRKAAHPQPGPTETGRENN